MEQRVLVVDDHPLMREAVSEIVRNLTGAPDVVQAASLGEALALMQQEIAIELAVLDLDLPDVVGLEGVRTLHAHLPGCPLVVMSAQAAPRTMSECIRLGASAFIPKTLSEQAMGEAFGAVARGDVYLPAQARSQPIEAPSLANEPSTGFDARDLGLTDRQIDVLTLLLEGLPNKVICRRLQLAEGTVKVHISAVFRALKARNRTQAVIAANALGLKSDKGKAGRSVASRRGFEPL